MKNIFNASNVTIIILLIIIGVILNNNRKKDTKTSCYYAHEAGMPCILHELKLSDNQFLWVIQEPDTVYYLPNGPELVARYESEKIAEKLQPAIDILTDLVKEKIQKRSDSEGMSIEFGERFLFLFSNACSGCHNSNSLFLKDSERSLYIFDNNLDGLNDEEIVDDNDQINHEYFKFIAPDAKKAFNVLYYDEVIKWIHFLDNYNPETAE